MQQQPATRQRKPYTPTVSRAAYKPLVRRRGHHGLFRVHSATDPNTYYVVDTIDHTCTCPNGQAGKGPCWHLKACAGIVLFPAQMVEAAPNAPVYPGPALQECFGPLNVPA